MVDYNPKIVESKWQQYWLDQKLFAAVDDSLKENRYVLVEFPYPSGDGLHVGHVKNYTATDAYARYLRMKGYNVLHPTGWDAFGLPTENSAIKTGVHPAELTQRNTDRFRGQMQMMGLSYDWDREINTADPAYYKWTQWIFLKLFKRGLAYEDTVPINWCPSCQTGLANEEVIDSHCERCGTQVIKKPVRQWMLKITEYADRLLAGLEELDWPNAIKEIQRNWIGRKEGINITYKIHNTDDTVTCFTTRPDTNYGATFFVLAPEHPFAQKVAKNNQEVADYIEQALAKSERDRLAVKKMKTGVYTGFHAINNLNRETLPIWVSDFVLGHFGTGAVVGVPGHDLRDFQFAQAFKLPIKRVVVGPDGDTSEINQEKQVQEADGIMIHSEILNGLPVMEAKEKIKDYLEEQGWGKRVVSYSLRDWVFSRQRYWGEPIPLVHCQQCGIVPVSEDQLPLELPIVKSYEPTGTGESPLAAVEEWVNTTCPECDGSARRETNTMPQWAGSSWYWVRFTDPHNDQALASPEAVKRWLPPSVYVGGAEHAVLHLLYGRFWNMVLHDEGVVNTDEPFPRRHTVGVVLGADNQKMSKSRGNVVNPDDEVAKYGADTVRMFALFMGPFDGSAAWTTEGISGSRRFLKRVWDFFQAAGLRQQAASDDVNLTVQKTIKRVTDSIEQFKFNTGVAALMELLNVLEKDSPDFSVLEVYVKLLSPYAPHIAEDLWQQLGHEESILLASWPEVNEDVLKQADLNIPVQINGKVRGTVFVAAGVVEEDVVTAAKELPNVAKYLSNTEPKKIIFVPDKLINFVV